ncbi:hypothetical protein, partial [Algoriphagus taiwanensis]|uniref:hypothetical protein n=1 Tax=Algoriphagus taiwanensis TaxID=1445656 RepID=UPI0030C6C981
PVPSEQDCKGTGSFLFGKKKIEYFFLSSPFELPVFSNFPRLPPTSPAPFASFGSANIDRNMSVAIAASHFLQKKL